LNAGVGDIRVPLVDGVSGLPEKVAEAYSDAHANEKSIDEKHRSDLIRIRDAYVTRLKGAVTETSDEDLKRRLSAQADQAGDLDAWVRSLSPEAEREVKRNSAAFAGSFVGKWDIHSSDGITQWIAHSDGRVEIVGKDWVASWEMIEDGTLEVTWDGKPKPYRMTRDGKGWVGRSPFGRPVSFTPGEW
jgi:hypothetical protein